MASRAQAAIVVLNRWGRSGLAMRRQELVDLTGEPHDPKSTAATTSQPIQVVRRHRALSGLLGGDVVGEDERPRGRGVLDRCQDRCTLMLNEP